MLTDWKFLLAVVSLISAIRIIPVDHIVADLIGGAFAGLFVSLVWSRS